MALWWRVFNLDKITQRNLLLWQGITQHVPTIMIWILKAGGGRASLGKTKGAERGMLLQAEKILMCAGKPVPYVSLPSHLCLLYFHIIDSTFPPCPSLHLSLGFTG